MNPAGRENLNTLGETRWAPGHFAFVYFPVFSAATRNPLFRLVVK